jgi:hypothetical protein
MEGLDIPTDSVQDIKSNPKGIKISLFDFWKCKNPNNFATNETPLPLNQDCYYSMLLVPPCASVYTAYRCREEKYTEWFEIHLRKVKEIFMIGSQY